MEQEKVPHALFKYKALNEFTYDLIKTDLIFLPTYDKLNDAFEGQVTYDESILTNKLIDEALQNSSIEKIMSKDEYRAIINSDNPKREFEKWVYEGDEISDIDFKNFSLKLNESVSETTNPCLQYLLDEMKSNTFVLSFSDENDLNSMWGHYANSNKGICIEYDFYDLNFIDIQYFCYKTIYLEPEDFREHTQDLLNIPETPYFNFFIEPFLRKTFDWKYENEWRIILPVFSFKLNLSKKINGKQFLKLPKPKAIYLGLNIEEKDKKSIISICKKREIDLYQMKKSIQSPILEKVPIIEFPRSMHGTEFLENDIKTKNIESIIYNFFNSFPNNEHDLRFLTEALSKIPIENQVHFLDTILFKNEVFPVLIDYYYNILKFLYAMNKSNDFNELKTSDGLSVKENINQWIYSCFTWWEDKKIVRYLIVFENLLKQYYSRYVLLNDKNDELKYKNDLKNIALISDYSTNQEKLIHPFCDVDFDDLIKINILDNLEEILERFYIAPCFNEDGCYEEYLNLKNIVEDIKEKADCQYEKIRWNMRCDRLMCIDENFDWVISGICDVLMRNNELLDLLNEKNKSILKKLVEIKFEANTNKEPNKIANYLDDCCDYLKIKYRPKNYDKSLIEKYYDPKNHCLEFFN